MYTLRIIYLSSAIFHTTLYNYIMYIGPPNIAHIDHNKSPQEGNKINLSCIATNDNESDQALKIQWYNSGGVQVVSKESRISIYNTTNKETGQVKSVLLFDPVNRTDSGVYMCKAFNHPKSYIKANANLTVKCKLLVAK